jgi:serine/threonine-protein kinase HipA
MPFSGRLHRSGALEFALQNGQFNSEPLPSASLTELIKIIHSIEQGETIDRRWQRLLDIGSSPGGARPKAFFQDEKGSWVAKFPSRFDQQNQASVEAATLDLLEAVGVQVPKRELLLVSPESANGDILLIKRFDRNGESRIPVISAATLLTGSTDSYLGFADRIKQVSSDPIVDQRDLFVRMLFNIMVSNRDDHPRNHMMLYIDGGYRLSPAFDVVAGEGHRKGQAMATSLGGFSSSLHDAIDSCRSFSLERAEAESIADDVTFTINSKWEQAFIERGLDPDQFSWAFENRG